LITASVIALVCLVRLLHFDFFDRLERMTYDPRVRAALRFPPPVAANLGFVFISDDSITALNNGSLGFRYGLYWPRHVYGRLVRELSAQGAEAVAFDILFRELRPDHAQVPVSNAQWPGVTGFLAGLHPGQPPTLFEDGGEKLTLVESDDYFAWQLKRAGMAILAGDQDVLPHPLFATNALAVADISADRDTDGVLRRAKAFRVYRHWHPAFKQVEADPLWGVDLSKARVEKTKIILPRPGLKPVEVPIDADNQFEMADFFGDQLPPGLPPKAKAFTDERVWHMGVVLAARELKLDLAKAEVDLERGRVTLRGAGGVQRVLPVDREGYLYINWELTATDSRLTKEAIESLLAQDQKRSAGREAGLTNRWRGRLVIVGSCATGNDLTDRGATPLAKDTFLVSKHWNVANSIITGRFVRPATPGMEIALIVLLGLATAWLTWNLRVFLAVGSVILLALGYCGAGLFLYVQYRFWLPLVLPILGVMFAEQGMLIAYRVVFEQKERRKIKSFFSHMVSPNIVNELLKLENLPLDGTRGEVTVFFADVRGFTEFTDVTQEQAAERVRRRHLTGGAAEACFNESAGETLNTVNLYLACVADTVKQHDGTLDKYIGDCVMAFWGAPTPNPRHALACVRAAMEAQRAIHEVNRQRAAENQRRELENRARVPAGLPPNPPLPILMLGMGINTGLVTVGLMGSDAHIRNYTVFGREVNLASRLESVAGRGHILISEATYEQLRRDDPPLAIACVALPPVTVKGIHTAVNIYEVPWLPTGVVPDLPPSPAVVVPAGN